MLSRRLDSFTYCVSKTCFVAPGATKGSDDVVGVSLLDCIEAHFLMALVQWCSGAVFLSLVKNLLPLDDFY